MTETWLEVFPAVLKSWYRGLEGQKWTLPKTEIFLIVAIYFQYHKLFQKCNFKLVKVGVTEEVVDAVDANTLGRVSK